MVTKYHNRCRTYRYRFPQSSTVERGYWMGDHPGTPRAVGNTWCSRHMHGEAETSGWQSLLVYASLTTPQFTATKCDWSLDLSSFFFFISLFHILHSTFPFFSLFFFFFSNLSYLFSSSFLTSEASSFPTFILYSDLS